MNAIELLESQHRDIDELFNRLEGKLERTRKREQFEWLADLLAIHSTIEELHFYPAARAPDIEQRLLQSLEEHLSVKRLLADLLVIHIEAPTFDPKLKVLREQVQHHVEEERNLVFPRVGQLLGEDQLEALGQLMIATLVELEKGHPRRDVPAQVLAAPPLTGYVGAHGGNLLSRIFPRMSRLLTLPLELLGFFREMLPNPRRRSHA